MKKIQLLISIVMLLSCLGFIAQAQPKMINDWRTDVKLVWEKDAVDAASSSSYSFNGNLVYGSINTATTNIFQMDCDSVSFVVEVTQHRIVSGSSVTWSGTTLGDSVAVTGYLLPTSPSHFIDSLALTSHPIVINRTTSAGVPTATGDNHATFGSSYVPGTYLSQRQYAKMYLQWADAHTRATKYNIKIWMVRLWLPK